MIDITITATRRPTILDKTLKSFTENLFFNDFDEKDFRVIINIDPVGEDISSNEVLKVAEKYFSEISCRMPKTPSFSEAFYWCWCDVKNDMVFHLEEDWELLRPIDFYKMLYIMQVHPNIAHLRLSTWKSEDTLKQWKWFLEHNGNYFQVPEDVKGTIGFCGHPSLNRATFIHSCTAYLNNKRNPEKQIKHRNKPIWDSVKNYEFGVFQEPNSPIAIRDIGRKWMVENGWSKEGNKEWFTNWTKAE